MDHVERPAAQPESSSLDDATRQFIDEDGESRRVYLRESWLAAAMATLYRARWGSGLTQVELAQRLGTTQSAIARLERSEDTKLSTFWDYLYACDVTPAEIETVPVADFVKYVYQRPSAGRKAAAIAQWAQTRRMNNILAQTAATLGQAGYRWREEMATSISRLANTVNVNPEALQEPTPPVFTRMLGVDVNAPFLATDPSSISNTFVQPVGSRPRAASDQVLLAA